MTVVNTVPPTLSGTFRSGRTVQTSDGTWTFDEDYLTYEYEWQRCDALGANCLPIGGATNSAYTLTGADVGSTIRAEVTATEHTGAPSPPSGELLYSPPTLSSPSTYTVTSGTRFLDGGNTDWIVDMPATALGPGTGGNAALTIKNVNKLYLIGGEILINTGYAGGSVASQYGIYILGSVNEIFIEGVWIHGTSVGQAIVIGCGAGQITIQNCRLETTHPVGAIHTDAIQSFAGPHTLRMYQNTLRSNGLSLQMQPREHCSGCTFGTWHYERMDMYHLTATAPALNKSSSGGSWWAEEHYDMWLQPNPSHSQPIHCNWSGSASCWNPGGGTNVTGDPLNIGAPPDGNFVPLGVAGTGYVSPGYQ